MAELPEFDARDLQELLVEANEAGELIRRIDGAENACEQRDGRWTRLELNSAIGQRLRSTNERLASVGARLPDTPVRDGARELVSRINLYATACAKEEVRAAFGAVTDAESQLYDRVVAALESLHGGRAHARSGAAGEFPEIPNEDLRSADLPPPDSGLDVIFPFGHTFNGYQFWGGLKGCVAVSNRVEQTYRQTGCYSSSLTELRTALFVQMRGGHWDYQGPTPESLGHIHALVEAIRAKVDT